LVESGLAPIYQGWRSGRAQPAADGSAAVPHAPGRTRTSGPVAALFPIVDSVL